MAINFIRGNILSDSLVRGSNLSFQSSSLARDVLFVDVVNGNVAVNTSATTHTFTVWGNCNIRDTVEAGNVETPGSISAVGNITGNIGNFTDIVVGNIDIGNIIGGGNLQVESITSNTFVSAVGDVIAGNVSVTGNVEGVIGVFDDIVVGNIDLGNLISGGNLQVESLSSNTYISAVGNVIGGNINTAGQISATGNITGGNVSTTGNVTADWFVGNLDGNITAPGSNTWILFNDEDIANATAGFTFDKTSNLLSVSGNVVGANLFTAGQVTATGNITGGNVTTIGLITATGNITGGNIATIGVITATGNITGGNITTGGKISSQGNVSTSGTISATGNISGGNLTTNGDISAAGNITAANFSATGNLSLGNLTVSNTTISTSLVTGNITLTPTGNALVIIDTVTGLVIPVGNISQRPGTPLSGTLRFNSETERMEIYDGTEWDPVVSEVTNQILYGDNSTSVFTLDRSTTAAAVLIMFNGIVQLPGVAYTVAGNVVTFAQAPAVSDVIDVRFL